MRSCASAIHSESFCGSFSIDVPVVVIGGPLAVSFGLGLGFVLVDPVFHVELSGIFSGIIVSRAFCALFETGGVSGRAFFLVPPRCICGGGTLCSPWNNRLCFCSRSAGRSYMWTDFCTVFGLLWP